MSSNAAPDYEEALMEQFGNKKVVKDIMREAKMMERAAARAAAKDAKKAEKAAAKEAEKVAKAAEKEAKKAEKAAAKAVKKTTPLPPPEPESPTPVPDPRDIEIARLTAEVVRLQAVIALIHNATTPVP
jgi:hypothetical protein